MNLKKKNEIKNRILNELFPEYHFPLKLKVEELLIGSKQLGYRDPYSASDVRQTNNFIYYDVHSNIRIGRKEIVNNSDDFKKFYFYPRDLASFFTSMKNHNASKYITKVIGSTEHIIHAPS